MIITCINGGLGNQLFQYAAGRQLAYKFGTELKLDITPFDIPIGHSYRLDKFNINATIATPEEIASLKSTNMGLDTHLSLEEFLKFPDNTYLKGWWGSRRYFLNISDLIRKEITLREPLSPEAEAWKQKILSAECSVSMHFRHGDFVYNPTFKTTNKTYGYIPPLERYCDCVNLLKPIYKNLTVFVFSNNISFIKENLHLDVPTEFVENCKYDFEELYLMSLCKHSIKPFSTFSWWASWLNQNPDKKILQLNPYDAKTVENWHSPLSAEKKDLPMEINVPFDKENDLQNIEMRPFFSLLLIVNNDAATIADTLDSLLAQDYKYYEIIIIDNASTDGSRAICRQKIDGKKNVTFKKLHTKATNAKAWNVALGMAQGYYVSFLKGNDRLTSDALTTFYITYFPRMRDIFCCFAWLEEKDTDDKKSFVKNGEECFKSHVKEMNGLNGQGPVKLLLNHNLNSFLGTKIFYREFLMENKIKFDKQLDDAMAEIFFQIEAFFKSRSFLFSSHALYIAPKNN